MNTSAEQENGDHSNEDKMHDKTSASANKGINEKLSLMKNYQFRPNCHLSTRNKFIHVPVVLCAFVEKLHIKSIWRIVQNTNV